MEINTLFVRQILILTLITLVHNQNCIKCYNNILDQCEVSSQYQIVSNYLSFSFDVSNLDNIFYDLVYNQKVFQLYEDIQGQQKKKYSISEIYTLILESLLKSKKNREKNGELIQSSRRSFTIPELFHFKQWYIEQSQSNKAIIKSALQHNYLQILGIQGVNYHSTAYYLDIINLYQEGLIYLKQELSYIPKICSTNSLEKTNLMILKLLGFQVILNKEWDFQNFDKNKVSSSNLLKINKNIGQSHNFFKVPILVKKVVDSFDFNHSQTCQVLYDEIKQFESNFKSEKMTRLRMIFMNISKFKLSNSYFNSVQKIMDQYGRQKCKKSILSYGNYKYFSQTLNSQQFKQLNYSQIIQKQSNNQFNSFYYFGRKFSNFLINLQKLFFLNYFLQSKSLNNINCLQILQSMKNIQILLLKENISQNQLQHLLKKMEASLLQSDQILSKIFQKYFPIQTINPLLTCKESMCTIPKNHFSDIILKVLNFQICNNYEKISLKLPIGQFYESIHENLTQFYQCQKSNEGDSCFLIIYMKWYTFSLIRLKKVNIQKISQRISYYKNILEDQNIKLQKNNCILNVGNIKMQINILNISKNSNQVLVLKSIKRYTNILQKKYKLQYISGYIGYIEFNINKSNSVFFNFPMQNNTKNQLIFQIKLKNSQQENSNNYFLIDSNGLLPKQINLTQQWVYFNKYLKYFSNNKQIGFFIDNSYSSVRKDKNNIQIKLPHLLSTQFGLNFKIAVVISSNNGQQEQIKKFQSQKIIQVNSIQQSKRISFYRPNWQKIDQWKHITKNYDNIIFLLKIYNQTSGILTVVNQKQNQVQIKLFADDVVPILSIFYGSVVKLASIQEVTLGANINYAQFTQNKFYFEFQSQSEEQQFYEKTFKQQITLRPFSIRSFKLNNLTSYMDCQSKFNFTKKIMNYSFKKSKQIKQKEDFQTWEDIMKNFVINGNHCTQQSPVTKETLLNIKKIQKKEQIIGPIQNIMKQKSNVKQTNKKYSRNDKKGLTKNLHNSLTKQEQISIKEKIKQIKQEEVDSDIYLKVDQEQFISIKQKIMRRQKIQRKQKFIYFKQKLLRIKLASV